MSQGIFTQEQILENDRKKQDLVELIRSRNSLLLVGAGCSVDLGYKDWAHLIDELENLTDNTFVRDPTMKNDSPLLYIDKIRENIKSCNGGSSEKYYNKLVDLYSPHGRDKQFDDLQTALLDLNFKGIITTNYDKAIEAALADKGKCYDAITINQNTKKHISSYFLSLDFGCYMPSILHLHGIHNDPAQIILSEEDYKKFYGDPNKEWTLHRKILWALLATRRLVFVGFSFKDPFLAAMLNLNTDDLWRWGAPIHYAIMPISLVMSEEAKSRAKDFRERYGIETIFYIDHDGTHFGLRKLIAELVEVCKAADTKSGIKQKAIIQRKPFNISKLIVHIMQKLKFKSKVSKGSFPWVDATNKRMTD